MRWLLPNGKETWKNMDKYRIDYTKGAPSKGAQQVKLFIQQNYSNCIWYEEMPIPTTRLKVDFCCPTKKIAIEYDGVGHISNGFNKFFHRTRANYLNNIRRDELKDQALERNGYTVIRIFPEDLDKLSREWLRDNWGVI